MKIKFKVVSTILFCVITMLTNTRINFATSGVIDPDKDVKLTINYNKEGQSIPGASFELYRIADVSSSVKFTLTENFKKYSVNINNLDSDGYNTLAQTLSEYVQKDELSPIRKGTTDEKGLLVFQSTSQQKLKPGMYLVLGSQISVDNFIYETAPFILCLPNIDQKNQNWMYDVSVIPKYSRTEISLDAPKKIPKVNVKTNSVNINKPLPQTGMLWWPILILVLSGMILLLLGLFFKKREGHE